MVRNFFFISGNFLLNRVKSRSFSNRAKTHIGGDHHDSAG